MNRLFLAFLLVSSLFFTANAQESLLEDKITGAQVGPFGAWLYQERALCNSFSLRGEVGLGSSYGYSSGEFVYNFRPEFTLEPRLYLGLKNRLARGKSIANNTGLFVSLQTTFRPNLFNLGNDKVSLPGDILVLPSFGYRGKLGERFDFEIGTSVGVQYEFNASLGYNNQVNPAAGLRLRVGYTFGK